MVPFPLRLEILHNKSPWRLDAAWSRPANGNIIRLTMDKDVVLAMQFLQWAEMERVGCITKSIAAIILILITSYGLSIAKRKRRVFNRTDQLISGREVTKEVVISIVYLSVV